MEEPPVSHPRPRATTLNDAQRAHLAVAELDSVELARFIAATHDTTEPVTALCWLAGATLAAGLAEQLSVVAALADTDAGARLWNTAADRVRDTAVRFELWATLAEPQGSDHVAHDAA
jgi:putative intracellular protease/amidase